MSANQVVTRENKEEVYKTGEFLYERFDISSFSATPIVPVREEDIEHQLNPSEIIYLARDLLNLEEKGMKTNMLGCIPYCFFPSDMGTHRMTTHGCSAGRDMAVISAKGEVRGCTKLTEIYGNLLEETLKEIWNRITQSNVRGNIECEKCGIEMGCYGGCEVRAAFYGGEDPLIRGLGEGDSLTYLSLENGKRYIIPKIRFRREGESLLIGDGGGFVFGNSSLLQFMRGLEEEPFTIEEIEENFGIKGKRLITYLYNCNLVKDDI